MCNKYRNPRSKRRLRAQAKSEAQALVRGTTAPIVPLEDKFLREELSNVTPLKLESVRFKKEKPLKQGGNSASGKQALSRGSKPLI